MVRVKSVQILNVLPKGSQFRLRLVISFSDRVKYFSFQIKFTKTHLAFKLFCSIKLKLFNKQANKTKQKGKF